VNYLFKRIGFSQSKLVFLFIYSPRIKSYFNQFESMFVCSPLLPHSSAVKLWTIIHFRRCTHKVLVSNEKWYRTTTAIILKSTRTSVGYSQNLEAFPKHNTKRILNNNNDYYSDDEYLRNIYSYLIQMIYYLDLRYNTYYWIIIAKSLSENLFLSAPKRLVVMRYDIIYII